MRKVRIPKLKAPRAPKVTGRHSGEGRAARPKGEERYRGTHRGVPPVGVPESVKADLRPAATRSRGRSDRPGVRVGGSDDRPDSRPRARFKGADQVGARIDYERRQRDEERAARAAGGGRDRSSLGTTSRGQARTMGQPKPARSRFKGESSSAEKNATARKLNPNAPTVRGSARRPSSDIRDPHAIPGQRVGSHRRDPMPETHGKGFAGAYFGAIGGRS